MNGYLLDTNIISDLIRNPSGSSARRIEEIDSKEICTSIVVAAELRYGCAKKGSARLSAKVERLLKTIPVMPLDAPVDINYGTIRSVLEASGQTIGFNDLLIAAHASALNLTLVTDNTREFRRIDCLSVENWIER